MTAEEARGHIAYSEWTSRRLLDATLNLTDEQKYRDVGVANRDIVGTLAHVKRADATWLARLTDTAVENKSSNGRQPHEALKEEWPELQRRWKEWSAPLTDAGLRRVVAFKAMDGHAYEAPVWQIVMHVVNHATMHRGQAMAMLRQMGIAPPPTDLMFYYREQK